MSDPLMNFLNSVDRDKVMAEQVSIEKLYAEAPADVREVIDVMPIGVLRRRLAAAEKELEAARRNRKERVRVLGNRELAQMVGRLRQRVSELEQIRDDQALRIAELRMGAA